MNASVADVLDHCIVEDIVESQAWAGSVHLTSRVGHVKLLLTEQVGRELKVVVANLPWRSEFSTVKSDLRWNKCELWLTCKTSALRMFILIMSCIKE